MSRYRYSPPNRWVIPSVVGASVVAGAVSVPLVLSSGALSMTPDAMITASASASAAARVSVAATRRRTPASTLALAGQPPAGREAGSKVREVTLQQTSGPPGSKVVVTGYCMSNVDTEAAAGFGGLGVTGAVTRALSSSGTFSLTLRAPRSAGDMALAVACQSAGQTTITWHLTFRVLKSEPTTTPGTPGATSSPPSTPPSSSGESPSTSAPGGAGTQPTGGQQSTGQTGQQNAAVQTGGSSSGAG